ncbi:hypothetical protein [uncultured Roseibium sp.]|uniref:A1S_2505 family phage non-structural protein n=1 Tax=uncultured Roseibium sp. TaxID=1936171 RepID=UPI0026387467|nr:hypothetical protein [uncultured Roseibium sp.]
MKIGHTFVFVFGSNSAGRHGKGAAKYAADYFGAERGVGRGRTGNAYAIPTKDDNLGVRPWEFIEEDIRDFIEYAKERAIADPLEIFVFTPVGCGLAGYSVDRLKKTIKRSGGLPPNVLLSNTWIDH